MPLGEFRKIIADDLGNMRNNLFDDNVRAFQSYNAVNSQILATLQSPSSNQFPVLNNGVTIVAKEIRQTGDKLLIEDYQIVNGCQTSSVVFDALDDVADSALFVPLKVVGTDDDAVLTAIVQATNSQTAVKTGNFRRSLTFKKAWRLTSRPLILRITCSTNAVPSNMTIVPVSKSLESSLSER